MATTTDFPRRMASTAPMAQPAPINRKTGVSLDPSEEARRQHDADCDAYHEWQGRMSAWLRNPIGPQPY